MVNTPKQITQYPLDDTPVWSPDGTRIALATYRQDHWDIAVANADGSGYTQITSSPPTLGVKPVNNVAPRWSPDGKSIAFVSDRDGAWYIYVMNPDGSNQHKLLDIPVTYDFASERVFSWTK
jgi:TolB protein